MIRFYDLAHSLIAVAVLGCLSATLPMAGMTVASEIPSENTSKDRGSGRLSHGILGRRPAIAYRGTGRVTSLVDAMAHRGSGRVDSEAEAPVPALYRGSGRMSTESFPVAQLG